MNGLCIQSIPPSHCLVLKIGQELRDPNLLSAFVARRCFRFHCRSYRLFEPASTPRAWQLSCLGWSRCPQRCTFSVSRVGSRGCSGGAEIFFAFAISIGDELFNRSATARSASFVGLVFFVIYPSDILPLLLASVRRKCPTVLALSVSAHIVVQ